MNILVDIIEDRIIMMPLTEKGDIKNIYNLSAFEAATLGEELISKAKEIDDEKK